MERRPYTLVNIKGMTDEERRAYNNVRQRAHRKKMLANRPHSEKETKPETYACHKCKIVRPFTAEHFEKRCESKWGLIKTCKRCTLARKMAWQYGITPDEYLAKTSGVCAICNLDRPLNMDHCHNTGNVRDGLCRGCNTGLGGFEDDPERMRAAAEYIERHQMLS